MNLEDLKRTLPEGIDLSLEEDLAIGVMNLISLEEHLFHTASKTNDATYLTLLDHVRSMRTEAMRQLVTDPKGEEWCASKHLLAASKRFEECSSRLITSDPKRAQRLAMMGADLFALFFALRLGTVRVEGLGAQIEESQMEETETREGPGKLTKLIRSIVDCCKEW